MSKKKKKNPDVKIGRRHEQMVSQENIDIKLISMRKDAQHHESSDKCK